MGNNLIKTGIFIWTVFCFSLSLFVAIKASIWRQPLSTSSVFLLLFAVELTMCWVAYQVYRNKVWATKVLTVFYALCSVSVYSSYFSFHIKYGLNVEIKLASAIGLNVLSLICFVLLLLLLLRSKIR
jgi:hypothetical protein